MPNYRVISRKNLPASFPVTLTLVAYLYMERPSTPAWACGVIGTIVFIFWISALYRISNSEDVDLTKEDLKQK